MKQTYIFINSLKKVYFILIFDIVISSNTTVRRKIRTIFHAVEVKNNIMTLRAMLCLTYLKLHFVLSKLTLTSLLSFTKNSI